MPLERRGVFGSTTLTPRRRKLMRQRRALLLGGALITLLLLSMALLLLRPAGHKGTISQQHQWYAPGGLTWREFAAIRAAEQQQGLRDNAPGRGLPPMEEYMRRAQVGPHPVKLKYPVLWSGALFSKSGYGTEAISYVTSLIQLGLVAPEDVWVGQSGDHIHADLVASMEPATRDLLQWHHYRNMTQHLPADSASRPLVAVCHSFPDCWRTPADDDTRPTVKKVLKAIGHFFKHTVARIKYDDSGCPCPYWDINDQVVYRIGRSMFETDSLPQPLVPYARNMDEVWVPSEFNRRTFSSSGVSLSQLHTLYEGINTTQFNVAHAPPMDLQALGGVLVAGQAPDPSTTSTHRLRHLQQDAASQEQPERAQHGAWSAGGGAAGGEWGSFMVRQLRGRDGEAGGGAGAGARPYRFLSVFKWELRKGWDILLRAYVQEFRGDPDVELHIVTKAAFKKVKDWPSFFRAEVGPVLNITSVDQWDALPRIILHFKHIPDTQYPGLYADMDALVIPTHGEGWGRPQIEAMAMGLPVITTNWSGLTAFIDERVAYPIRVARIVDITDEDFDMFKGQRWAQPDETHLRALMRQVYTQRAAAAAKGAAGRAHIQAHFSELAVAQQLLALLLRVQDQVDDLLWGESSSQAHTAGAAQQAGGAVGHPHPHAAAAGEEAHLRGGHHPHPHHHGKQRHHRRRDAAGRLAHAG